jgi:transcription elongation factor GreA
MPTLKNPYKPKIKRIPVTREGFEKLQKELEDLKKARPEAVNNLAIARNMGDLSENGLYTAAKARLRSIDSQIFRTDIQIKLAEVVKSSSNEKIGIGSKVTIKNGESTKDVSLVGDYESSPFEGKISQYSPLGKALIGKKKGEIAILHAPSGEISYTIVSIS